MTTPHPPQCAHSIVAHLTISAAEPGAVIDAWACCDCGARFSRDESLPEFVPELSHLHLKLETVTSRLRDAEETLRRSRQINAPSAMALQAAEDEIGRLRAEVEAQRRSRQIDANEARSREMELTGKGTKL